MLYKVRPLDRLDDLRRSGHAPARSADPVKGAGEKLTRQTGEIMTALNLLLND